MAIDNLLLAMRIQEIASELHSRGYVLLDKRGRYTGPGPGPGPGQCEVHSNLPPAPVGACVHDLLGPDWVRHYHTYGKAADAAGLAWVVTSHFGQCWTMKKWVEE